MDPEFILNILGFADLVKIFCGLSDLAKPIHPASIAHKNFKNVKSVNDLWRIPCKSLKFCLFYSTHTQNVTFQPSLLRKFSLTLFFHLGYCNVY